MVALTESKIAPDFSFIDADGKQKRLSDVVQAGPVILYFYPRDFTPGCTIEACDFRDNWAEFKKRGITVIGVSTDTGVSHKKFREKYNLPFALAADDSKAIVKKYGVFGEKKFMGRTFDGTKRTTFLIGKGGKIKRIYKNVRAKGHVNEILESLPDVSSPDSA